MELTSFFLESFEDILVNDVNAFIETVLNDLPTSVTVHDAFRTSQIAVTLTHSFPFPSSVMMATSQS
ncbi:expressed protein [Cryptococcus deneoformans JEC21]|uniref:Expressed protein n=1 Tax=Cryptococcus deneoformans (strain JEC21 / ATCC MYA-565) TaxID=214684 RepID=Q5KJT5_CRYD1|nr:expressed protein [Cryptococcus neoformans var. neoformans JEC21]AAW42718.1 expressed protein [Cryptococcus neoformans var. neoformans JEC21]